LIEIIWFFFGCSLNLDKKKTKRFELIPLDVTKASATHDQTVKLQIPNSPTEFVSCIAPVNLCHHCHLNNTAQNELNLPINHNKRKYAVTRIKRGKGYLFLPRNSVKQVQNFRIKVNLVLSHHLLFTELYQWNQSCISKIHETQIDKSESSFKRSEKRNQITNFE
jgi:hypothetical protein